MMRKLIYFLELVKWGIFWSGGVGFVGFYNYIKVSIVYMLVKCCEI